MSAWEFYITIQQTLGPSKSAEEQAPLIAESHINSTSPETVASPPGLAGTELTKNFKSMEFTKELHISPIPL